jgi:hypothetical protein
MKIKILIYSFLSIILFGCTTQKIVVNQSKLPENLGVYLSNSGDIDEYDYRAFIDTTKVFIDSYNLENHRFKLYYSEIDSNSVKIDFTSNKYATRGKQALGVIVTGLGIATFVATLATPEIGYYLIFWYNPKNSTVINVSLTKDIDPSMKKYIKSISTRHQFQSLDLQKEKQKKMYYSYLSQIMSEIENNAE